MLEHTEGDKELVVEFTVTVPEEWGIPGYNIGQRVQWLSGDEEISGVVMGITYDETMEEWDYECAREQQFRKPPYTGQDRAEYTSWIRESELELDEKRVALNRLLNIGA
ncbi:hypothetical protein H6F74_22675 [Trichocoleus sp. FACHB-90]|uniref:hypothetical protein n=1 Tax=Cyanophyceae TaxID=3028117 RepID=UPI00168343FF|nr:hypothetical protein [Trichocoleus sp. FACHB-90]MBD1929029.1 hypothetical protein [Trichocoleus sp. FACHB-90]